LASYKIAFVHNYYIHYRVPLFELMADKYDVIYFFDAIHPYVKKISTSITFKNPLSVKIKNFSIPLFLWCYLIKSKLNLFIAGDALNLSTIVTFIISKLLRKPFILWEERWIWTESLLNNIKWPFVRLVTLKADLLVVSGSKAKKFYKKEGVNEDRIFIAPNASYLEISKYHENKALALRNKFELTGKTVILYLGRVIKPKGIHILLKAFGELCKRRSDLYLIIAGNLDREYAVELNYIRKQFNLNNVLFIGFVPIDERGSYFKLADIVVYPSFLDAWGLVINEAMSAGKAVISTTNSGGACDLIKNNVNGYLVPPRNSDALYSALKKLVENPKFIREFGKASRKIIEKGFTYHHMYKGFDKAIKHILKNSYTEKK